MKHLLPLLAVLSVCGCGCGPTFDERYAVEGRAPRTGDVVYSRLTGEPVTALFFGNYSGGPRITCRVACGRTYRDGIVSKDSFTQDYAKVLFLPCELTWTKPEETP